MVVDQCWDAKQDGLRREGRALDVRASGMRPYIILQVRSSIL
jgi:hypothetical protein